jgi:hypothetical protein
MRYFAFFFSLLPLLLPAQSHRYFVHLSATGANNGSSWANAFTNLHDALTVAMPGDEVWVATGTYKPTNDNNRDIYFKLPSGVRLYGGFAGTEDSLQQRQPADHPSVLNGDIGVQGDRSDNSYNLLYAFQPDSSTLIDGFTFTEAEAVKPGIANFQLGAYGAALLVNGLDGRAHLTVRNCRFERNKSRASGGAVCVNGGGSGDAAPLFESCVFTENTSESTGGAVYRTGGSRGDRPADFLNCRFERNKAFAGGAIYYRDNERSDTLDIRGCHFSANLATNRGYIIAFGTPRQATYSAMHLHSCLFEKHANSGGRTNTIMLDVFFDQGNFDLVADSCKFSNNEHMYLLFELDGIQKIRIKNTEINNNNTFHIANGDTGLRSRDSLYVYNVSIHDAYVSRLSGIKINKARIYATRQSNIGAYIMQNTLIAKNIFEKGRIGGGTMIGNTFVNNIVQFNPNEFGPVIKNCIISDNYEDKTGYGSLISSPFISCFENSLLKVLNPNPIDPPVPIKGCSTTSANLLNTDPMFIDTAAGDYRLHPCSPAIDRGGNAAAQEAGVGTDVAGNARIQGGRVDIGAYESPDVLTQFAPVARGTCTGESKGTIEVKASGGCPPYRVSWSNGTQSGSNVTGLEAGSYRLTVTDGKGRTGSITVVVPLSLPAIAFQGDTVVCAGAADATLSASVTGSPAPPFRYLWADGSTKAAREALGAGSYALVVTDTLGCRDTAAVSVITVTPPQTDTTLVNATLPLANNGVLEVNASGQYAPYTFLWNTGEQTGRIENLPAGVYQLTLTDREGCTFVSSYRINAIISTTAAAEALLGAVTPNPAADDVLIQFGQSDRWTLWNNTGQLVRSISAAPQAVVVQDLSDLPAGMYWYAFGQTGKMGEKKKLVKW